MRPRAWAWLVALIALVMAVIPLIAMSGVLGLRPMSIATANGCWIAAIVLTLVSFVMSIRQGMQTRA